MSSLLLSLSSKPSLRKLALRCHTLRMFSSSTTTNPYMMYYVTYCGEAPEAGAMTELRIFDPAKEEYFTVRDKPLTKELVTGVAISSSPEEEDFVMAVKFTGRRVSIYRPGQYRKGNHRFSSTELFDYFEQANLMYSKRDQRFYMPSSGGHHLWSWNGILSTDSQYHDLRFHNLPLFSLSELQLLRSCYRTQHLVESPSGQRFLVKWYVQTLGRSVQSLAHRSVEFSFGGTKLFMVFREEEDMNMCYTEDIGDLCIFLGNNEPFCVKASSFPGLNPNSIYFLGDRYGEGYGVYDIATRTPRSFNPKSFSAFSDLPNGQGYVVPNWVPHWIPPFPL
ncbi:hypothetical protein ISN44_As09g032010 [Arabidopsis suecica]|uniref:KIB1-4 beta-propeller domain-containing protein n=1 Tax=Arabidopsis suecica TaxID=45249 RepID=A0A8T2AQL5_ARASU|nr:hypothetical protein ISN44_As09g032010 [Arabidopsis suecica]